MKSRGAQRKSARRTQDNGDVHVDALANSIGAILRRFGDIRRRARALGIFAGDRELLDCPSCGLMEDVLISGILVTCHEATISRDTGLRFVEHAAADGRFMGPECGTDVRPPDPPSLPDSPSATRLKA
jgi:hypothetical protein